jgi:hypothetical protein
LEPLEMDAPEVELDIKLQKVSGDLVTEFERSLGPFLRKSDGSGGLQVRSRVRISETYKIIFGVSRQSSYAGGEDLLQMQAFMI